MKTQISKINLLLCLTALFFILNGCGNNENKKSSGENHTHSEAEEHQHIYACPMHPEITGKSGDKCPKCGMALVHMDEKPVAGNFKMTFKSTPANIQAGKPAALFLTPKNIDNTEAMVPLDMEHEKKIHLILVDEGLSWFDHIHPEYQPDGSYMVDETFPHGGNYILFADYKPSGSTHQIEKIVLTVTGEPSAEKPNSAIRNTSESQPFVVTLKPDEGKFAAGKPIHFDGVFTKDKKPFDVNNLQNYLGAKGHMVAIHTEVKEYIHLHPEVENDILHFHTTFDKAGTYRVWLQFMADNKLHTTDFLIEVN